MNQNVGYISFLICTVFMISASQSEAQSLSGNIVIEQGGELYIDGKAGPVDFRCRAKELSGQGEIKNSAHPQRNIIQNEAVQIAVSLPVKSLDCGKSRMNSDMYEALKSDRYPLIHYRVLEAALSRKSPDDISNGDWMQINTRGVMEIAGVKDTTTVLVKGRIDGDRFQVKGSKKIHMDSFDIDPPSKMFGLIKANKQLEVFFNVTVQLLEQKN